MIAIKARREQSTTPPCFPKVKFSSSRQHHRPTYLKKITPLWTRSPHNLPLTYSSRPTAPPTNGTVKTKRLNTWRHLPNSKLAHTLPANDFGTRLSSKRSGEWIKLPSSAVEDARWWSLKASGWLSQGLRRSGRVLLTRRSNRFDLVLPITIIPYLDSQLNISSVPLTKKCEIWGVHILASKPLQFDFQTSNGDILDMWLTSTPALRDSAPLHTYVGTKSHSFLHSVESGKGVARRHIISLHNRSQEFQIGVHWSPLVTWLFKWRKFEHYRFCDL